MEWRSPKHLVPRLFFVLFYWTSIEIIAADACGFIGLIAECEMTVGGVPLMVTARVNHCNSPIDVTFLVRNVPPDRYMSDKKDNFESSHFSANPQVQQFFRGSKVYNRTERTRQQHVKPLQDPEIEWQYTFVTTNQPESREIPGFYSSSGQGRNRDTRIHDKRVLLHMVAEDKQASKETTSLPTNSTSSIQHSYQNSLTNRQSTFLQVKAQFLVNGQTDDQLSFLSGDSGRVHVPHFDECAGSRYETEINYIVLGTIVVIVILGCLSLVGLFIYRDHRSRSDVEIEPDRLDLVGNMHQQSPARPYSLTRPPGEYLQAQNGSQLNDMVHYVVPDKLKKTKTNATESEKGENDNKPEHDDVENETNDLKVYVSTPNGLKRVVERTNSQASSNSNAPTLPQKSSQHLASSHTSRKEVEGKKVRNESINTNRTNIVNSENRFQANIDELPPPPLPRKPQIQDPLGVVTKSEAKDSLHSNSTKNLSLNLQSCNTANFVAINSSDDSSPPSSLSAESTNSEGSKFASSNGNSLGAIPKRKNHKTGHFDKNDIHGLARDNKKHKISSQNVMSTQHPSELSSYNVIVDQNHSRKSSSNTKQSVISNGIREHNGYKREPSSAASSSPLSTASSSGSTIISR